MTCAYVLSSVATRRRRRVRTSAGSAGRLPPARPSPPPRSTPSVPAGRLRNLWEGAGSWRASRLADHTPLTCRPAGTVTRTVGRLVGQVDHSRGCYVRTEVTAVQKRVKPLLASGWGPFTTTSTVTSPVPTFMWCEADDTGTRVRSRPCRGGDLLRQALEGVDEGDRVPFIVKVLADWPAALIVTVLPSAVVNMLVT